MAITKITRDALSTGIDDNSDATAITIGSDEAVDFTGKVSADGDWTNDTGTLTLTGDKPTINFEPDGGAGTTDKWLTHVSQDGYQVYRAAGGTNSWNRKFMIDPNGRVTMPYQPAFDVSAVPTSHATNQVVDFVTINTNIGNCWNNTTNRFVAPVSGMYQFNISVFTHRTTNQGDFYWDLRKNTHIQLRMYDSKEGAANRHCQVMGSHSMYMAANDYADIFFVTSPGGVAMEASGAHNRFSGYLIG